MSAPVALDALLAARRVWRGRAMPEAVASRQPSGHAALDACLPQGGWPEAALIEILIAADGIGELTLLFPTLARLTQSGQRVLLIAPPYGVHAPAWQGAGVVLSRLHVVRAAPREALWAAEQCLRSAACAAVLCWPLQADERALRRLQVAAQSGQCLGFAFRDARCANNPSPAALRVQIEAGSRHLRIRKCRGGLAPAHAIAWTA